MESSPETKQKGAFFSIDELAALFPRLKQHEQILDSRERFVLNRIEKVLYEHLSVEEIENRLEAYRG